MLVDPSRQKCMFDIEDIKPILGHFFHGMRGHIILTQSNACSDPFYPASWHMSTVLTHAEKQGH
jgi:hypothetical protein